VTNRANGASSAAGRDTPETNVTNENLGFWRCSALLTCEDAFFHLQKRDFGLVFVYAHLCGRLEHEPPARSHRTDARRSGDQVRLCVIFAAEPTAEAEVRGRIEAAPDHLPAIGALASGASRRAGSAEGIGVYPGRRGRRPAWAFAGHARSRTAGQLAAASRWRCRAIGLDQPEHVPAIAAAARRIVSAAAAGGCVAVSMTR
jgi:hypothetical protein